VSQPDWSEEGRYLQYDGFSVLLFYTYLEAMEAKRVPLIPLPYSDEEMKRVLVEKHILSEREAEDMIAKDAPEHWRGPTEGREDEKYKDEMREIEEGESRDVSKPSAA
jgi:hypothetical protein